MSGIQPGNFWVQRNKLPKSSRDTVFAKTASHCLAFGPPSESHGLPSHGISTYLKQTTVGSAHRFARVAAVGRYADSPQDRPFHKLQNSWARAFPVPAGVAPVKQSWDCSMPEFEDFLTWI